ncbi:hypothetical protein HCA78_12740 [Listeria booriae]|uniref:Uncharacterized protein n=1 Tax=Listeria booriae TaxID=1552123 RepID=A0A842CXE8_9LIST|nr:hypothetical protein [Listeria booriae]MBC2004644.1 hypothetical protein [Listeria booriae]
MATIKAPNEKYNGTSAGVGFINGVGKTDDPWLITIFNENGYTVIEDEEEQKNGDDREALKASLDNLGVEYAKNAKTETLQKLLDDNNKQEGE